MTTYNKVGKSEYDTMCPPMGKTIIVKDQSPWFDGDTLVKKREKRLFEYVILERLIRHLEVIEALPGNQSAYKKLYSTETAISSVVNHMLEMMDEIKCGILILLDLSAAFDTVVYELLLYDLQTIGNEDQAFEYLKDYLAGRNYSVQIGSS
ncbi:uncharacterized protein [Palaemon carinicauda]|uniref:uncharacterized protein n=1 Tax=Palaemon carinicauda TaxID=392227 RepID=UPI0035B68748